MNKLSHEFLSISLHKFGRVFHFTLLLTPLEIVKNTLKEIKNMLLHWILNNLACRITNYKALVHLPKVEMSTLISFHL